MAFEEPWSENMLKFTPKATLKLIIFRISYVPSLTFFLLFLYCFLLCLLFSSSFPSSNLKQIFSFYNNIKCILIIICCQFSYIKIILGLYNMSLFILLIFTVFFFFLKCMQLSLHGSQGHHQLYCTLLGVFFERNNFIIFSQLILIKLLHLVHLLFLSNHFEIFQQFDSFLLNQLEFSL